MSSILSEYIDRKMGLMELQTELQNLIKAYNKYTERYLFVYSADLNKARNRGIDVSMIQDDFYNIQDMLRESEKKKIDFYIETPGGSGEAAEEIAKFLRKKFEEVNFIIAGEAKSAGTILVLSGDNIYMTETGSLGPIDAQVRIGRSVVSAHDYKEWIDQKRDEANKDGKLNPVDAVMIAQISPGELSGVVNSLEFAKDLVKEWLWKFKFKDWKVTKTRQLKVTDKMKKERAIQVAEMFCDHTTWRTHGRSLKIEDLKDLLIIERIDDDNKLAEIVYRIKTLIRLIFDGSTIYKLFYIDDLKISKVFSTNPTPNIPSQELIPFQGKKQSKIDVIELQIQCQKCGKHHKVKGYFDIDSNIIKNLKLETNPLIKDNNILVCDNCNFSLDLNIVKNQIEAQQKRKVVLK